MFGIPPGRRVMPVRGRYVTGSARRRTLRTRSAHANCPLSPSCAPCAFSPNRAPCAFSLGLRLPASVSQHRSRSLLRSPSLAPTTGYTNPPHQPARPPAHDSPVLQRPPVRPRPPILARTRTDTHRRRTVGDLRPLLLLHSHRRPQRRLAVLFPGAVTDGGRGRVSLFSYTFRDVMRVFVMADRGLTSVC